MKKYFVILAMMLIGVTTAFAEEGDKWVGLNFNGGFHKDYTNFGLGLKGQYEVRERLRLEAAANYFFKKDDLSMWDANLNVHYLIPLGESANVYPVVGPSLMTWKGNGFFEYKTKFGVNLGAGIEYRLDDHLKVNCDVKYQYIKDIDRPVVSLGASYLF